VGQNNSKPIQPGLGLRGWDCHSLVCWRHGPPLGQSRRIGNMHRFVSKLRSMNVSDDHLILGSEACHCPTTGYAGGDVGVAWARAERYRR